MAVFGLFVAVVYWLFFFSNKEGIAWDFYT